MITSNAISASQSQQSNIAWLFLLTITTPTITLRFVNNDQNITSRGNEFSCFPFSLQLPVDDGETVPTVTLRLQNFDNLIVQAIRGEATAPQVTLELVTTLDPNYVEIALESLVLRAVNYDALEITGTLGVINVLTRGFGGAYSPHRFPGLFA